MSRVSHLEEVVDFARAILEGGRGGWVGVSF